MARSASGIFAIAASTSRSPSAPAAWAFSSRAYSFIAAFSSAEKETVGFFLVAVLLVRFCVLFSVVDLVPVFAAFFSAMSKHLLDADVVARGIAERAIAHPIGLIGRFLDDLD